MSTSDFQALNNIISIMDSFTIERHELGVREVARLTGMSPSTAGRVMLALKEAGLLQQNPDTRLYMLGAKVLAWAEVYASGFDIRKLALPAMRELYRSTQETISLYILEGDDRICIERMESPHSVRIVARIGRRLPLYAGSAGKLMLAFLSEERQRQILFSTPLKAFTANTITDAHKLFNDLETIREEGYAFSNGEWILEAAGIAAPILGNNGELMAALTISGPAQRFTPERVETYRVLIMEVAAQISSLLGFTKL